MHNQQLRTAKKKLLPAAFVNQTQQQTVQLEGDTQ
jgi:hypothetical protein